VDGGVHVWIVDLDNAYGRLLEERGVPVREEWLNRDRVTGFEDEEGRCSLWTVTNGDWEAIRRALNWAFGNARLDDWVVIDGVTLMWAAVKDWAIEQAYGTDMPTFMLKARLEAKDAKDKAAKVQSSVLDLYEPIINPQWHSTVTQPMVGARCHVYMVADENSISPRAGKDTKTMYERIEAKPDTQKRVGHNAATVVHTVKTRVGDYGIEMLKDWGREERWPESGVVKMGDGFVKGYLRGVAGWKPSK
jgi:hypothetical protein